MFEPKIVAFLCRWCSSAGADLAGVSRLQYPANFVPMMINCTGRLDAQMVLEAFERGADGVFVGGCHTPSDCHYKSGNFKALKRVALIKKMLSQVGIEPLRLRLEWVSASEGKKFAQVSAEFVGEIRKLGPINDGGKTQ